MTITSYGYAGDVEAAQWSRMHPEIGSSQYGVRDINAWKVTPAGGTRTVSISAGVGWGKGVMDVSDAAATLTFPSQPSGVRYDMVVMRRTFTAGPSVFYVVPGGSAPVMPGRTTYDGGVSGTDDQPLALVKITAGSSAVVVVNDLRVYAADGGVGAFDDMARSYMNLPATTLTIGKKVWQRRYLASGVLDWDLVDYTPYHLLWSGADYMTAAQAIDLPETISSQKTGILLVWSAYDDAHDKPLDDLWSYTDVPIIHIGRPGTKWMQVVLATDANPSTAIVKRLNITDSRISGHTQNDAGAAAGRVLRAVYGF